MASRVLVESFDSSIAAGMAAPVPSLTVKRSSPVPRCAQRDERKKDRVPARRRNISSYFASILLASLCRLGIEQVRDVRIPIHGEPAGRSRSIESRRVKSEPGNIHNIAFVGDDDALALDRIADLSGHDQPELRAFGM